MKKFAVGMRSQDKDVSMLMGSSGLPVILSRHGIAGKTALSLIDTTPLQNGRMVLTTGEEKLLTPTPIALYGDGMTYGRKIAAALALALALTSCGDDDVSGSDGPRSANLDFEYRWFDSLDPVSGKNYRCIWAESTQWESGGLWCDGRQN